MSLIDFIWMQKFKNVLKYLNIYLPQKFRFFILVRFILSVNTKIFAMEKQKMLTFIGARIKGGKHRQGYVSSSNTESLKFRVFCP